MKPEVRDIWESYLEEDDRFELMERDVEDRDYNNTVFYVFKRMKDNTYWSLFSIENGTGDYMSFRDDPDTVEVTQVYPKKVTKTIYT